MSSKPTASVPRKTPAKAAPAKAAPAEAAVMMMGNATAGEVLLVCLQDPFDAPGDSTTIVRSTVPLTAGNAAQLWNLEAAMEMNTPRFFAGWATRGVFTLDLSVHATVSPVSGTWGGTVRTTSGSRNCRVIIGRDSAQKLRFSLATGARHAPEQPLPPPDRERFLNADIAFELNGSSGLSATATAVISSLNWSRLIANSTVATKGLGFDSKWRQKLEPIDGDASVLANWAFALMTQPAYEAWCTSNHWSPYVLDHD